MTKKIIGLAVVALLTMPLWAENPGTPAVDKKVGTALLDSIARLFQEIASRGTNPVQQIEDFLVQSIQEARKAKDNGQLDPVFFARYQRLLGVIKMTMAPDPGGILVPVLDQELKRFVYEVLGEEYKGSGPGAIGQVANAIADELINLQLHLENIETKAKLRKAFDEKFIDATPKK